MAVGSRYSAEAAAAKAEYRDEAHLSTLLTMMDPLAFGRLAHPASPGVFYRPRGFRRRHFSGGSSLGATSCQRPWGPGEARIVRIGLIRHGQRGTVRKPTALAAGRASGGVGSRRTWLTRHLGGHDGEAREYIGGRVSDAGGKAANSPPGSKLWPMTPSGRSQGAVGRSRRSQSYCCCVLDVANGRVPAQVQPGECPPRYSTCTADESEGKTG